MEGLYKINILKNKFNSYMNINNLIENMEIHVCTFCSMLLHISIWLVRVIMGFLISLNILIYKRKYLDVVFEE